MNKRHKKLMEDLGAAKPPCSFSLEEWAESEDAKRILAHVLSSPLPEKRSPRPRRFRASHFAWIGGVVVVALAVALSLYLLGEEPPESATRPETTTTAGLPSREELVTVDRALEHVIAAAHLGPGTTLPERPGTTAEARAERLVKEAKALGLFGSAAGPGVPLSQPVTRAQFALWVWRAFGPALSPKQTVAFSDLGELSAEEREAVKGLADAGILEPYPDGTFQGSRLLSREEEAALLANIMAALAQQGKNGGT